jgi:hypothetical protein
MGNFAIKAKNFPARAKNFAIKEENILAPVGDYAIKAAGLYSFMGNFFIKAGMNISFTGKFLAVCKKFPALPGIPHSISISQAKLSFKYHASVGYSDSVISFVPPINRNVQ